MDGRENIKAGGLVYLVEDNISHLHWPLARIEETIPGKDDIVRIGIFTRPTVKLRTKPILPDLSNHAECLNE